MNKLLLVTDAWEPQVNGVVTTFKNTIKEMKLLGWDITVISPEDFISCPLPFYKEISISLNLWKFEKLFKSVDPTYIHIATEGVLGLTARNYCIKNKLSFTTSYHTDFEQYVNIWLDKDLKIVRQYLNWFHKPAKRVLVPSKNSQNNIDRPTVVWGRGVDYDKFYSNNSRDRDSILCVSRLSKEKKLEEFVALSQYGELEKRLVGSGPYMKNLKYFDSIFHGNTTFVGKQVGQNLIDEYHRAAVFIFPSTTDTFGIVMLEALAAGVPVIASVDAGAATDIIEEGVNGFIVHAWESFEKYIPLALTLDRNKISQSAKSFSWYNSTQTFIDSLVHKHYV